MRMSKTAARFIRCHYINMPYPVRAPSGNVTGTVNVSFWCHLKSDTDNANKRQGQLIKTEEITCTVLQQLYKRYSHLFNEY